jgi:cytochrome c-type biogenesis protein CcmH/NrfG
MNSSRDLDLEKQIDAYIKGRLTEDQVKDLWIELFKRPKYIDLLETELSIKLIIEEQLEAEKGTSTPVKEDASEAVFMRSWKWLATAASIVILVIAFNFFEMDQQQTIQQLTLGEINLVENLATPEVMRSQGVDMQTTALDSLLNLGFKAAISGDRQRALQIYQEVVDKFETDPQTAMAHLNIGIIKYNSAEYQTASDSFVKAIELGTEDRILEEKAYWYLGNTYLNMDDFTKAKEAIENAYRFEGIYQKPASRLLEKLEDQMGSLNNGNTAK